jgi:hypothetical protein
MQDAAALASPLDCAEVETEVGSPSAYGGRCLRTIRGRIWIVRRRRYGGVTSLVSRGRRGSVVVRRRHDRIGVGLDANERATHGEHITGPAVECDHLTGDGR